MTRQGLGIAQGQGEGEDDNSSMASGQTLESSVVVGAGGEGGGHDEAGAAVGEGGEGGEKKEEKHDHKPVATTLTTVMRETLRVKLGSLIHRKLSAILPDIFTLAGDPTHLSSATYINPSRLQHVLPLLLILPL